MPKQVRVITQALLLTLTVAVLSSALYLQYVAGLAPCPLCYMQRVCVYGVLLFAFTALFVRGVRGRYCMLLQLLFALAGIYFASRQLWLQSLPAPLTEVCLPGVELLIHYLPWREVLQLLVLGSQACNEVMWQACGLSMAAWSALYFSLVAAVVIGLVLWERKIT